LLLRAEALDERALPSSVVEQQRGYSRAGRRGGGRGGVPQDDIRGRRVEVDDGQAQGEEVAWISLSSQAGAVLTAVAPVVVLFLLAPGGVELQRSL
jgi:hypothetical protein